MQRNGSTGRRRSSSDGARRSHGQSAAAVQRLENRHLLSVAVAASVPAVLAHPSNPSEDTVDLASYLQDPNLPGSGTVVTFTFAVDNSSLFGKSREAQVQVALTDAATPITVANFLRYVNNGLYDGTFLHRAVDISSGSGGSPSDPATIDQGGGYYINDHNPAKPTIASVESFGEIENEASSEVEGNIAGTIAMARTSDVNSASNEWYFNVSDNSSDLDSSTSNSDSSDTTGYCVFGEVLGDGLATLTTISELPTTTLDSALGLTTVPVTGVSEAEASSAHPQIGAQDLVYIKSVTSQPGLTYTVSSSDPTLVRPSISGNSLSFAYGSGSGTAAVTVTAKDYDGSTATTSFLVTVPVSGSTTTTPVVAASTATAVSDGSTTTLTPLAADSDASSALNPASVAITAAPADGTATVDTATGQISYTPTTGFVGTDTISYTVAGEDGTVSSPATITIDVTAAPASVTIGTKTSRSLVLTQPSGAVDRISVSGGTAVITFAGTDVTQSTAGSTAIASGADATIASITITDATRARASLSVSGGAITLGSITNGGVMNAITGGSVTLGGTLDVAGLRELSVGATDGALLEVGSGAGDTAMVIPVATDTAVQASGKISTLRSSKWIIDNGGAYAVSATGIGSLDISGEFDDALDLSGVAGDTIATARIGGALGSSSGAAGSATWTVGGSIGRMSVASTNVAWALSASGTIGLLRLDGDVASAVSAGGILNMAVTGADSGAITSAGPIDSLSIGGADSGAVSASSLDRFTVAGDDSGGVTATATIDSMDVRGAVTGAISASTLDRLAATGSLGASVSVTGAIGTISAAGISGAISGGETVASLLVHGDLTGSVTAGSTVSDIEVTGNISGSTITTTGTFSAKQIQLERISVGGAISDETISAAGNIGTITAGSLASSGIYAGITDTGTLPTVAADFTSAARILAVRLSGRANPAFSNSNIAAETLGDLSLGTIDTSNSGTAEGVAGENLSVLDGTLSSGGRLVLGRSQLRTAAALSAYLNAKNITLGDFQIDVISPTSSS